MGQLSLDTWLAEPSDRRRQYSAGFGKRSRLMAKSCRVWLAIHLFWISANSVMLPPAFRFVPLRRRSGADVQADEHRLPLRAGYWYIHCFRETEQLERQKVPFSLRETEQLTMQPLR
jgi:hypothetical protein